jgi:hypothetical protein
MIFSLLTKLHLFMYCVYNMLWKLSSLFHSYNCTMEESKIFLCVIWATLFLRYVAPNSCFSVPRLHSPWKRFVDEFAYLFIYPSTIYEKKVEGEEEKKNKTEKWWLERRRRYKKFCYVVLRSKYENSLTLCNPSDGNLMKRDMVMKWNLFERICKLITDFRIGDNDNNHLNSEVVGQFYKFANVSNVVCVSAHFWVLTDSTTW